MNITIPYKPFPYQMELHKDTSRHICLAGGRRSAKTACCIAEAIKHCLEKPNRQCTIVGQSYRDVKEIIWDEIMRDYEVYKPAIKKVLNAQLNIEWKNGSRLYLKSGDKPDSLRGRKNSMVILDEAFTLHSDIWYKILRPSMADTPDSRVIIASTPGGMANWFYDIWQNELFTKYHWPTSNNPLIPVEELEALKRELDTQTYETEILGLFVSRGGVVYKDFGNDNILSNFTLDSNYSIYLGIDLGFCDKTGVCFLARDKRIPDRIIQFDEIFINRVQIGKIIEMIEQTLEKHGLKKKDVKRVWCDVAGNAFELTSGMSPTNEMRKAGLVVSTKQSKLLPGISLVRAHIKSYDGKVRYFVTDNCKNTINSFYAYSYTQDKYGNTKEEPGSGDNHEWSNLMDALRYAYIGMFDNYKYVMNSLEQSKMGETINMLKQKKCRECQGIFLSKSAIDKPPFVCNECEEKIND